MIYALHLSILLCILGSASTNAPNWVQFIIAFCMLLFYGVSVLLWELHCKKVRELEREVEKLKNKKTPNGKKENIYEKHHHHQTSERTSNRKS